MKEIILPLVSWYQKNKRELPWREDKDPYHVWISEIMLQQTRIEAVKKYYERFMKRLPTIFDLATIKEEELLKLWEGLGYYNRARNLQKAALMIVQTYHGTFPESYEQLLTLPGIGEYTAGAIASICFNKKEVAIDGNVLRVYMRLNNCTLNVLEEKTRKKVKKKLLESMDEVETSYGDFNEGLMELGETICTSGVPLCEKCPLQQFCQAFKKQTMLKLPIRLKKMTKKEQPMTVFLLYTKDSIALLKREEKNLLKNLWEFPNEERTVKMQDITSTFTFKDTIKSIRKGISYRHVFTHKVWHMKSYLIEIEKEFPPYTWVCLEEAKTNYAIPTAFQPFLKQLEETIYDKKN